MQPEQCPHKLNENMTAFTRPKQGKQYPSFKKEKELECVNKAKNYTKFTNFQRGKIIFILCKDTSSIPENLLEQFRLHDEIHFWFLIFFHTRERERERDRK